MTQSTFSAQVANNLLTVLQGYTKGIRFIAVLTMLCTIGVGNAWAADFTLTSANSVTVDGVTVTFAKGSGSTAPTWYAAGLRLYAKNTVTITSESEITSIVFDWEKQGNKTFASVSANTGSYSHPSAPGKGTWTGSSKSVIFTLASTSGVQLQLNTLSVTTANGGGDEPPTPSTTYTIKWHTAVGTTTDVTLNEGAAITKPATDPTMTGYTFMGWTEDCEVASNGAGFTPITNFGTATEDKDYYAVFAEATTTGGGGGSTTTEQTKTETFENQTASTTYNSTKEYNAASSNASIAWKIYYGTVSTNAVLNGSQSAQMRWYNSASANLPYIQSTTLVKGLKSISFTALTSDNDYKYSVSYSTNGTSWTSVATGESVGSTSNKQTKSYTINANGVDAYIKIAITSTTNVSDKATFRIDDVVFTYLETTSGGGGTTTYDNYITTCAGSDTPETFTVTFNANGHGTAPTAQTITSGEKASEPTAPEKTGYTFGGWYENQQCTGNQFNFDTPITADITLYAKWTIAEYTIKATLEHCTVAPEIPTTYTYTGSAANWAYTFTPEDGYGLPKIITFSGCDYTWDQSTGVLTLTGVIKSNVTFTIAAKKIHTITWQVDGEEYTTGDPSTTVLNNEQVSKLPTNPTLDCSGKTFVGWSDQEVTDGNKPSVLFTSAGTSPQILKTTTFHAVFAILSGSGNGQNTTDILTHEINGKGNTNNSYEDFSDKSYISDAAYAGNSANGNNNEAKGVIQLRSDKSTSGIVTTTSGGYAKSIIVNWHSHTTDGRTLDIYGKNEAYSAASDLYDANTRGTKLGSIVKGTSTVLTIDGDYRYIGLRSASNAIYINSISIVWSSSAAPTYTGYTTTCTFTAPELDAPDGLTVEDLTCSIVTLSWNAVDNASSYEVIRTLNGHNTSYPTTETTITIENLEGGNENSWKVRAIGDGINYNNSEYADGENFTTLFSVKYYVDGVIWHGCDNGCVANGGSFDICEEAPIKANNTFAGWATTADGEVAYQAGATINNIASNVTLHAVWDAVTYIVNWSVNGIDNQVTYTHGQDLELPTIDIEPCDGMDHVGWTDQLAYRHGTDKLFTEASGTVTSDATYYAVFATKTSSDGGAETTLDFSQGYANGVAISSATEGDITVTFDKGTNASNAPKYYTTGAAIRVYGGNTFTVSSDNTISKIAITFSSGEDDNEITTNVGTYSNNTWTGSANSITFTIDGSSGHRRIQSIAVTSTGNASYYTDHTTTCESRQLKTPTNLATNNITYNGAILTWDEVAGARSYKVVINGTGYNTNTNSYITHPLKSKTDYTWTVQAIGNGTTFINSEISAEATFTTAAAVTITWIAGATKTTNTITYGQSIGEALGELPTPATPDGCKGKTFKGWTTTRKINSDGTNIEYLNAETVPTENTTYYAVFAQGDIAGAANITDELTHTINGKESGNNYNAFTDKKYTSDARYAGSSANGNSAIQLRGSENSGIVTTTSGGSIKSITVEWESHTTAGRTLDIYGKNTAYNDASDLYNQSKQGTLLGSIVYGTSTSLTIDGNYQYIGLRSKSSAMYLTSITIVWTSGNVTYTDYSTSCGDFLVTYYGFNTGYTNICGDNPGEITVPQFTTYTIPTCTPTEDPQGLNRTFAGTWVDDKGNSYKPGDSFEVTDDITLYAQWTWNTNTIPTDDEGIGDLATTDIVVSGGNTLTLQAGTTTINSLTLKGGLQENGTYAMPIINVPNNATLVRKDSKIHLDLTVNNQSYYPFAVPFEVQNIKANIHYLDEYLNSAATYGDGGHYQVLTYDGRLRAENGLSDKNWVHVGRHTTQKPSYLVPGKGYAISAVPAKGETTTTIRISMDVDNDWFAGGEQISLDTITRNQIAVTAYTGPAAQKDPCNAGWNFVANPYLTNFAANENITGVDYIGGEIIVRNGQFVKDGTEVPYVTIPNANMSWYEQRRVQDAILSPMYSFFVQIAEDGTMTFETAGRQQAPAALRASSEQANPSFEADIVILNNFEQVADHTGLVINDRWTPAYEIGGDLEKMFGTANRTAIYTLSGNTRLAYNALSYNDALVAIPIGFRAQADGEYTIQLSNTEDIVGVECIELKDLYNNQTTNLLYTDYTFYSDATQEDSRFVVYIVPQKNTPTDISTIINDNTENRKIIFNNHLYIIHNGNIYNGAGQMVK